MLINSPNISGSLNVSGNTVITGSLTTSIAALNTAATTFLTSNNGTIRSRTAAQTLSDIGAQATGSYVTISNASNLYVPYTGATASVNLGYNSLAASNINIDGNAPTAGSYLGFKQATTVNTGVLGYTSISTFGTNKMTFLFAQPTGYKSISFTVSEITQDVSGGRVYTMPDSSGTLALTSNLGSYLPLTGGGAITGSLIVTGGITGNVTGSATTASYVEYSNVANKPTLLSGSVQIRDFGIFATTGSNQFNGSQSITGSLTVSGQVIAQTLNVQQVTSSIVFSSGSNRFGNNTGNTHQFTGSLAVTGSLSVNGASTFANNITATGNLNLQGAVTRNINFYDSSNTNINAQIQYDQISSTSGQLFFGTNNAGTFATRLTISNTGAATFSGNLKIITPALGTNKLTFGVVGTDYYTLEYNDTTGNINYQSKYSHIFSGGAAGTTTILTLASTGEATFSSSVTATSGNFTVDGVATNSVLDILTLSHTTSGTAASGLGAGILFKSERPSGGVNLSRAAIYGIAGSNPDDDGDLTFYTRTDTSGAGFTEKMRITSDGNVLIGTTSDGGRKLEVQTSSTNAGLWVQTGGTTSAYTIADFRTGTNLPALQILGNGVSSFGGNVGIGTASPGAKLDILGTSGNISSDMNNGNLINLDGGSITSTNFGVGIAFLRTGSQMAYIKAARENNSDEAAYLAFATQTGAGAHPERMRITSGGYTKASNTGTYFNNTNPSHEFNQNQADWNTQFLNTHASIPYGIFLQYNAAPNSTGSEFLYCRDNSGSTIRATIRSNGGLANYSGNDVNLSDERVKKDIEPLESYWDKFKAIEIVKFKYKDQTHDDFNIGVIAQQVESVAPEFVDVDGWGNKPELDEEGNEIVSEEEPLKAIYTADLYHATIKVLQEAMAKIETLEAENDTLKSRIDTLEQA